jgi:hypothetical protein
MPITPPLGAVLLSTVCVSGVVLVESKLESLGGSRVSRLPKKCFKLVSDPAHLIYTL